MYIDTAHRKKSKILGLTLTESDIRHHHKEDNLSDLPFIYPLYRYIISRAENDLEYLNFHMDPDSTKFYYRIGDAQYIWGTDERTALGLWHRYYYGDNIWNATDTIYIELLEKRIQDDFMFPTIMPYYNQHIEKQTLFVKW